MATTIVTGSKQSQIPGIDGGTFTGAAATNFLILTRFKYLKSIVITVEGGGTAPNYTSFNASGPLSGPTSSGAAVSGLSANKYNWIAYGIGG